MSEASNHILSYCVETTRGTTPTNPRFQQLPDSRTTLALGKSTLATERLTGTRFPSAPRHGASEVTGEIPSELSAFSYDDFILGALQGAWVADGGSVADTCDLEIAGTPTNGAVVGDTYATTNGTVTVSTLDAIGQYLVLVYTPTISGVDETYTYGSVNVGFTIDGDLFEVVAFDANAESASAVAGSVRTGFSVMRQFTDFAADQENTMIFSGCEVASWNFTADANSLAKSTFTMFGIDMDYVLAANTPTGMSVAPPHTTEPFDTFSGDLEIDGVDSCVVTAVAFTVDNGIAANYFVGCPVSGDPTVGDSMIEGSLTAVFDDAALYNKYLNEESFTLSVLLTDTLGRGLRVSFPNLKVGTGTQPDVTAPGPIPITINFSAHYDASILSHIKATRTSPSAI
tara:strand:+ start:5290 stop:6489 length:1200 start_codon:yes stop_codon:yes gene_type:complete